MKIGRMLLLLLAISVATPIFSMENKSENANKENFYIVVEENTIMARLLAGYGIVKILNEGYFPIRVGERFEAPILIPNIEGLNGYGFCLYLCHTSYYPGVFFEVGKSITDLLGLDEPKKLKRSKTEKRLETLKIKAQEAQLKKLIKNNNRQRGNNKHKSRGIQQPRRNNHR